MFKLLTGGYTKEELGFMKEVLVEVKTRTDGKVHITFDFEKLAESFHNGETVQSIVDRSLRFVDDVESGEIKTTPYTDDFDSEWCGTGCECFPDPATETVADKNSRLKRQAEVAEIFLKLSSK
jgi:hypothetical protein